MEYSQIMMLADIDFHRNLILFRAATLSLDQIIRKYTVYKLNHYNQFLAMTRLRKLKFQQTQNQLLRKNKFGFRQFLSRLFKAQSGNYLNRHPEINPNVILSGFESQ